MEPYFQFGEKVTIRDDLVVGRKYFSEDFLQGKVFTEEMEKYIGCEVVIVGCEHTTIGYIYAVSDDLFAEDDIDAFQDSGMSVSVLFDSMICKHDNGGFCWTDEMFQEYIDDIDAAIDEGPAERFKREYVEDKNDSNQKPPTPIEQEQTKIIPFPQSNIITDTDVKQGKHDNVVVLPFPIIKRRDNNDSK